MPARPLSFESEGAGGDVGAEERLLVAIATMPERDEREPTVPYLPTQQTNRHDRELYSSANDERHVYPSRPLQTAPAACAMRYSGRIKSARNSAKTL